MAELNASEKGGKRSGRRRTPPRVDLTAMVDLAFLLITFFMLTTTLAKPRAQKLTMPDKTGPTDLPVPASRTMTVCLGSSNKALWYIGTAEEPLTKPAIVNYAESGLRKIIIEKSEAIKKGTGKDLIVLVKPSDHSVYENFVTAIDELNISGTDHYAIVDITPKDIDLLKQQHAY